MNEKFETHEHDVLIIGAGGAGLRAAIEALARARLSPLCASRCLAKHTPSWLKAASQQRWPMLMRPTIGARTFATRCAAESFLTTGAWPSFTRRRRPSECANSSSGARCLTGPPTARYLQRAFGGHTFKRLCHVGDRTGLEMIRTLQDRGVHLGIDVYMECAITRLLKDGDGSPELRVLARAGRFVVFKAKTVVIATGGIGKAWQHHFKFVGVHRRWDGPCL